MASHKLVLTTAHIADHLFNGGFSTLSKYDYQTYADAEAGSLIAYIQIGKYVYHVLFTPSEGDFEVYYYDNDQSYCWKMSLATNEILEM
jgi:hypothetical protein